MGARIAKAASFLVCAALVAAGAAGAQTISGAVRETECGPIPGADVILRGGSIERHVISEVGGVFTLAGLPDAKYSMRFGLAGFYNLDLQDVVPVPSGSARLVVTLPTEEASLVATWENGPGEQLKGNVKRLIRVQDQDCHPIGAAVVEIRGRTPWKGNTDAGGAVSVPSVRGGTYDIWIEAAGYSRVVLRSTRLPFRYRDELIVPLRRGPSERTDVFVPRVPSDRETSTLNIPAPPPPRIRIVAMGDSTTAGTPAFKSPREAPPNGSGDETSQYAYWLMKAHPSWDVTNQGVNAQRSDVIAARFDEDVVAKKPAVVVIIAGVNDVYQGRPAQHVKEQLAEMYQRARAAGIRVVAGTIIPYNTATADQNARMHEINGWIRAQADAGVVSFVDTRAAVAAPGSPDTLASSPDGLHPDAAGYHRMADAIAPAIERALTGRR